jgi:hypothetical protein
MNTRAPFENFPNKPSRFGLFADFLNAGDAAGFSSFTYASGSAAVINTEVGGALRLSGNAATDDSGINHQATNAAFGLVQGKDLVYLARVRFGETTSTDMPVQCDCAAGLATLDTSIIASPPTAGIYFRKDDGDDLLDCVVRAGGLDIGLSLGVMSVAKDTWYELAIKISPDPSVSGRGNVTFYVDGQQKAGLSLSTLAMASTSMLAPFVAFLSGNNLGTKFCDVDYYGAEQVR